MANPEERDGFGIIITYIVRVRLFLGALAGELVGELPIILMHPKVMCCLMNRDQLRKAFISFTSAKSEEAP